MTGRTLPDHAGLEKLQQNCHVPRVGPHAGRRRGRLYDNQNNGFGPLFDNFHHIDSPDQAGCLDRPRGTSRTIPIVPASRHTFRTTH
jgi:hypothetical protein